MICLLYTSGNRTGLSGSISGGAEMIVGKSKARGMDARLAKLTKIAAVVVMILAAGLVVLSRFAA